MGLANTCSFEGDSVQIRLLSLSALVSVVLSGCALDTTIAKGPSGIEATNTPTLQATSGTTTPTSTATGSMSGVRVAISSHCGVRAFGPTASCGWRTLPWAVTIRLPDGMRTRQTACS